MEFKDKVKVTGEVLAVLYNKYGKEKKVYRTKNIITTAGLEYIAQLFSGGTPTNGFNGGLLGLGSAGNAPVVGSTRADITTKITGTELAFDSGYPKVDDDDTENPSNPTGTNVNTYRRTYAAGVGTDPAIDRSYITNAAPGASEPLLCYALFASAINKGADDVLKVFWNITIS
jgi:hypothetical protein